MVEKFTKPIPNTRCLAYGKEIPVATLPCTIADGVAIAAGTVVGIITVGGKYGAYATGNTDGTQNPVGILLNDITADTEDRNCVYMNNGAVITEMLTGWDAGAATALPQIQLITLARINNKG